MPLNYTLFNVALALDLASVALLIPFLNFFIESVGFDAKADLGWLQSLYGALQAIGLPLAGFFAESIGRRPLLLLSVFGTPFSYFVKLIAMKMHSRTLFVFSRVLIGSLRHTMTSASAMVLDEAGEDEGKRAKALSGFQAAASAGFIFAPTIGGWIYDHFGVDTLCSCSVVCGICSAILMVIATKDYKEVTVAAIKEISTKRLKPTDSSHSSSSTTTRLIAAAKKVLIDSGWDARLLVMGMFANSVCYIGIQTQTSVYLRTRFDFTGFQVGLTISFSSLLNAVFQFASIKSIVKVDAKNLSFISPRTFLLIATWSSSLFGVCVLATSSSIEMFLFGLIFVSICSGAVDSLAKATLSVYFGNANALAMSLVYCMDGANRMLVPLVNSWTMTHSSYGVHAPLYMSACASILCSTCHTFGPTAKRMSEVKSEAVAKSRSATLERKTK